MKKIILVLTITTCFGLGAIAQTATIQVDASTGKKSISPFIYGKNNCLSDNPGDPLTASEWQILRDAGVKMVRENGGNNATKYNWRLKLSSHPDWYNNVYSHSWDFAAQSMQTNLPGTSGMWAFQLIGKAASNTSNNFNDWGYNQSAWWSGVSQNLAGGGTINPAGGSKALTDGNTSLYLMNWSADSTVGILDKWFGTGGLGYNKNKIQYWSMDNEPEIWSGTHDDIMPTQLAAEDFMQLYFAVAKKARAKYPEIKLVGPVPANEWQWYNWNNDVISYNGKNYVWLEFFIKRIAEEQASSGIRLLDALDIHFYPGETNATDIVQLHRVFFDKTYNYPGANGIKRINGGWDNSQTKEYVLERCRTWLTQHLGANHGVALSVSEIGIEGTNPNVTAVWYASTLGTFANEGVEIFTPWTWKTGMWETLHLFSRYGKEFRVQATSNLETYVSAYSSINSNADSLTVFLVNRHTTQTESTTVNVSNFVLNNAEYNTLTLSNLSGSETFKSHTVNALKTGTVNTNNHSFTMSLAPLSITAVLLSANKPPVTPPDTTVDDTTSTDTAVHTFRKNVRSIAAFDVGSGASEVIGISYTLTKTTPFEIELFDLQGNIIEIIEKGNKPAGSYEYKFNGSHLSKGFYIMRFKANAQMMQKKVILGD